jgi:DNA (cytosine-5)-methyltransferase 1
MHWPHRSRVLRLKCLPFDSRIGRNVADRPVYGIAICGGALGLELGIEAAIENYRTVCVLERETSVAGRMGQRIEEGSLPELAWWDDVATFDGRPWRGIIQVVSAGFPCQPWSVAGKRGGKDDERWIWPRIAEIIEEIEPEIVFLENVPGLLLQPGSDVDRWDLDEPSEDALGGFGTVLRDLARFGFDAEWTSIRASDVGASHGRKRVFILAYHKGANGRCEQERIEGCWRARFAGNGCTLEHAEIRGSGASRQNDGQQRSGHAWHTSERLADTGNGRIQEPRRGILETGEQLGDSQELGIFAPGPADPRWESLLVRFPWLRPSYSQAEAESDLRDVADGMASLVAHERTGALRALGNGVVPLQAAVAFTVLLRRILATVNVERSTSHAKADTR